MDPVLLLSRTSNDSRMLRKSGWGMWLYEPPATPASLAAAGFSEEEGLKLTGRGADSELYAR